MPVPINRNTGTSWNPLEAVGNFFFGKPDKPTWKPGGSNRSAQPRASTKGGQTWSETYPGVGEVVFGPGHQVVGRFVEDSNFTPVRPGGGAPYRVPGATPIVSGRGSDGNVDRTQSDQYRAAMGQRGPAAPAAPRFPNTPEGTMQRWFSPEMDPYFGAASRGAGAPQSLEAMNALAAQSKAPLSSPLATYYRAQSAAGQTNMDEIVAAMGYKGTPMEQWARSNQMLAQREYNKKFPGGRSTSTFPPGAVSNLNIPVDAVFTNEPLSGAQPPTTSVGFPATQGMDTSQLFGKGVPNYGAFTLPGGAMQQGTEVSRPFNQANQVASLYTNPQNAAGIGELEQSDKDLQQRVQSFLNKPATPFNSQAFR